MSMLVLSGKKFSKKKIFLSFSHSRQYRNHTSATPLCQNLQKSMINVEITPDQRGVRFPHLGYIKFNTVSTEILNMNS